MPQFDLWLHRTPRHPLLSPRRRYVAEALEPRRLLAGVTVITHGFNADVTGWPFAMAAAIEGRASLGLDVAGYIVQVTDPGHDGGPLHVQASAPIGQTLAAPGTDTPEIIITLDWSDMAGTLDLGGYHRSTVDIAAAVADRFTQPGFLPELGGQAIVSLPMHLIGHSRGGSLVAELARDLGSQGVWVDHVTTLDPHPVDGVKEPFLPLQPDWGDAHPQPTENVNFWDNYWRTDGDHSLDFTGQSVVGAFNVQLNEGLFAASSYPLDHSDVHLWYYGTIDHSPAANNGEEPVPTNWYGGGQGPRTVTGYNYARTTGAARPVAGVGAPFQGNAVRHPVARLGSQWPNVGPLGLEYFDDYSYTTDERIFLSFRHQDHDGSATVAFFADNDVNPFNGGAVPLGVQTIAPTSFIDTSSFNFAADQLDPGTWRLYAQASDGSGHSRYDFLLPAITITEAPAVTPLVTGQTVNGSIVDGSVQTYFVDAEAGDYLGGVIARTGGEPGYNPWIGLYSPSGTLLSSDWEFYGSAVGVLSAPQTGTYRFEARDLGNLDTGSYALTIVRLPATQDGGGDGGDIASGQTRSGSIGVSDVDLFFFDARVGETLIAGMATVSGQIGFNPSLALLGPDGTVLSSDWDYTSAGVSRANAPLDGTYTLMVRDFGDDQTGSYNLTLAKLNGLQDAGGDAGPIQSGHTRPANLGIGDIDVFTFTAGRGQAISVLLTETTAGPAFNPWIGLYGPTGLQIASAWDYVGTGVATASAPKDGTYYVVVADLEYDDTGSYNITLAHLPKVQHGGGDAGPIESGETRAASIGPGDQDIFTFEAQIGDSITVALTETSGDPAFNPSLNLYAPNGVLLDGRWDVTGTGVGEINVTQAGTYYVVAADFGADGGGNYNLTLARARGVQQSGGDGGNIQHGQTRAARIDKGDLDVFTFAATAGQSISIAMTETAGDPGFAPQIALYAPNGNYIHGGWDVTTVGTGSAVAPQTGIYYIVCSDQGAEDTGDYTLSLNITGTTTLLETLFSNAKDVILLRRNPLDLLKVDAWLNSAPFGEGTPTLSQLIDSIPLLNLLGGDDEVTIDYTMGAPLTPGTTINGGGDTDRIKFVGAPSAETVTFQSSSTTIGGGGGAGGAVNHANVERRTFDGRGGGDELSIFGATDVALDAPQKLAALTIDAACVLDVLGHALAVDYSSVSPVGVWTGSAYDGLLGYADTGRLVSSLASGALTTIGVAEARDARNIAATQTAPFAGFTVDATAVLVKFTWGGDANLDGTINIDDYGLIDSNVSKSGSVFGWFVGDFNLDGKINIDDYGIIDSNVAAQIGVL